MAVSLTPAVIVGLAAGLGLILILSLLAYQNNNPTIVACIAKLSEDGKDSEGNPYLVASVDTNMIAKYPKLKEALDDSGKKLQELKAKTGCKDLDCINARLTAGELSYAEYWTEFRTTEKQEQQLISDLISQDVGFFSHSTGATFQYGDDGLAVYRMEFSEWEKTEAGLHREYLKNCTINN